MSTPLDLNADSSRHYTDAAPATERTSPGVHAAEDAGPTTRDAEGGRRVLDRLSAEIGADRVQRYFDRQASVTLEGRTLDVTVSSGFVADVVGRRFGDVLRRAAAAELGLRAGAAESEVELRIRVDSRGAETPRTPARQDPGDRADRPVEPRPATKPAPRRPEPASRRFEGFLVGQSNRLAFAAAQRLAQGEDSLAPGPLFIHGPCGVGKTHLLQAASQGFRERHPGAVVRSITGEAFTNEFIAAVKTGSLENFRRCFRRVHLLVLDDVHFLSNKEATQRELLHTFDALGGAGAKILMASDEHPREIRKLSQQLVSRFIAGAVVKIDLPEHQLRVRIAELAASRRALCLEPAAAELLADRAAAVGGSVRDLEGLLTQVEALRLIAPELIPDGRIGALAVRRALGIQEQHLAAGPAGRWGGGRRPIPLASIAAEVSKALGVEVSDLMGRGRHRTVVLAREITVYLARRMTTSSFPEIARSLGRENHSTVLTAHKRLEDMLAAASPPKAELPEEYVGLTLAEVCQRIGARVERAGA